MKTLTLSAFLLFTGASGLLYAMEIPKAIPMKADSDINKPVLTDVIMEVNGRNQTYLRYGSGYFPYYGMVYEYDETLDPSPSSIIFGEGDTVYFHDLMDFGWDSYIKGSINGAKITVELPQTIFIETFDWAEEPYYNNLCVMTRKGEGNNLNFSVDNDITSVTYTMSADGEITLDPLPEGKALGIMTYFVGKVYDDEETPEETMTRDDENDDSGEDEEGSYHLEWLEYWSGAADFTQRFVPIMVELIEMPDDVEILTYHCAIDGTNYPVEVAFKDDYMYIKGLSDNPYLSNLVVRATIDGNRAFIPQNQFVGIYSFDNEMIITKCGYLEGRDIIFEDDDVSFEFTVDENRRFFQAADPDMYFCFAYMMQYDNNLGQNGLRAYFKDFVILYQDSYPGVPSDPYGLFAHNDYLKAFGYSTFGFELAAISVDHHMLLSGNMYYRIYIDDELEVFEYDPEAVPYSHYYMLPEATSEIPYLFDNDADLDKTTETEFEVGYYYEGVTTIGVQAVYYYDDNRTVSNIVTLNLETGEVTTSGPETSVTSLPDKAEIVSTQYYDLNGRKIEHPDRGIYIMKSIMSDGSIMTKKIAR